MSKINCEPVNEAKVTYIGQVIVFNSNAVNLILLIFSEVIEIVLSLFDSGPR